LEVKSKRLTASSLVRVIAAIIFMIALERCINAPAAIRTAELIQSTRDARAAFLVFVAAAIVVAVTLLLDRHTGIGDTSIGCGWRCCVGRQAAVNVVGLTFSKCYRDKFED